jgi:uncharacterized protein YbjT (DUF2867 family)
MTEKRKTILITGATGNVGRQVVKSLTNIVSERDISIHIIIADRNVEQARKEFQNSHDLGYILFDFSDPGTFEKSMINVDIMFLLRPPQISEVDKYFRQFFDEAKSKGIRKIVFLSVQGADKSKVIPHNKIELLIKEYEFEYIFVRPSYFMQNLTTTLLNEIKTRSTITLPSGSAKFNWIDARDIGKCIAELITSFDNYSNKEITITGEENLDYSAVALYLSKELGREITFRSINPISFYFLKRKQGLSSGFAIVMTILHFLPRLQSEPEITSNIKKITGKEPTKLKEFIEREKAQFM